MTDRDSLTEWFHALADQPHGELLRLGSPETIAQFRTHVSRSTPGHPLPGEMSASEFADAVVEFRRNESAWNRATMAAIIKADDLFNLGRR